MFQTTNQIYKDLCIEHKMDDSLEKCGSSINYFQSV